MSAQSVTEDINPNAPIEVSPESEPDPFKSLTFAPNSSGELNKIKLQARIQDGTLQFQEEVYKAVAALGMENAVEAYATLAAFPTKFCRILDLDLREYSKELEVLKELIEKQYPEAAFKVPALGHFGPGMRNAE